MDDGIFQTPGGDPIPAVTAEEMRAVDCAAEEVYDLPLPSMMEHAGRTLAMDVVEQAAGPVAVLAGGGGNGGGGICCARHLANHGVDARVIVDRDPEDLGSATAIQWRVLDGTDATTTANPQAALDGAAVAVDAVLGYGLEGAPRGRASALIGAFESFAGRIVSLDVPSGVDATTGERPGAAVSADRTLTLALPKVGLADVPGELALADVGIPAGAFERAGLDYSSPFSGEYRVPIWAP
jgi:NAD(P)H-hydrate epimerase